MSLERIMGSEHEYGIFSKNDCYLLPSKVISSNVIKNFFSSKIDENYNIHLREMNLPLGGNIGQFLENGARLYVDLGHPEYSTPEVTNPLDLIRWEKAGDRILSDCIKSLRENSEFEVKLFKHNSDGKGHGFACHLNFLTSPEFWATLNLRLHQLNNIQEIWISFLVSGQIIWGSGKIGSEMDDSVSYQISQRADFIQEVIDSDTVYSRAIICNRTGRKYSKLYERIHVIIFDSNMADWSIFLKAGTSNIILAMLEESFLPARISNLILLDPVTAIKLVSRDLTTKKTVSELKDSSKISALGMQFRFLEAAKEFLAQKSHKTIWDDVIKKWEDALLSFERDDGWLDDKLDWRIKKTLLENYSEKYKMKLIDYEYHNIDYNSGLYFILEKNGKVQRLVDESLIIDAKSNSPEDTRAYFRGMAVRHLEKEIKSIFWNFIHLKDFGLVYLEPFDGSKKFFSKISKNFL